VTIGAKNFFLNLGTKMSILPNF